jgi:hypothetical protein
MHNPGSGCRDPSWRQAQAPSKLLSHANTNVTMTARMRLKEVVRRRLQGTFLSSPTDRTPAEIVQTLGAIQSQDYSGAKWALGQRTTRATDAEIERAFDEGQLLRTHVLRPTWHFVAPSDIRWMLELTGPRVKALMASYDRKLGLDARLFTRTNDIIAKSLEGGKSLTRQELARILERKKIDVSPSQRLGHLMMRAELDGLICSGPRRGKLQTYALIEERAPKAPRLDRDEALLELATRYFTTRGPATVHDFSWWSGLTVGVARRGAELASELLENVSVDGRTMWFSGDAAPKAKSTAHLLPNYDEYFISLKDRSAFGERLGHSQIVTGGNALIAHVVAIDGQLVGGWKRVRDTVELDLQIALTDAERRRLGATVKRYVDFLTRTM